MPAVQQRRGTAAELAAINETPLGGQIYFETDTNKVKVGDGVRAYNSLPYLSESTSIADLDGLQAALDANAAAAAAAQSDTDGLSSQFAQHKSRHAITGTDPLSPADIGAAPDTVVSRVTANEGDILFAQLDISNLISITSNHSTDISTLQSDVAGITPASIGAQPAGTYATLVGGTVPASQLPSYVDDVIEASALASFPTTGDTGKIYVDTSTNKTYRWSGTTYVEISASPGSTDAVPEGSTNLYFTDARAQAALTSALSAKADTAGDTFTGTVTFPAQIISAPGVYINQFGIGIGASPTLGSELTVRGDINNYDPNAPGHRITTTQVRIKGPERSIYATAQGMRFNAGDFYFYDYATQQEWFRIDSSGITTNKLLTTSNAISLPSGSVASCAIQFTGDPDTGIVRNSANTLSLVAGGGNRLTVNTAGCTLGGAVTVSNGLNVSELSQSGAFTNDVLTWNGSAWLPKAPAGGSGGSTTLGGLTDTNIASPASSQFLIHNGTAWQNYSPATAAAFLPISSLSGQAISAPATGEMLRYDGTNWVNAAASITDVTNLQSTLNSKVDTTDARLSDARTPTAHTHPQSDITNLVTDLAAKADLSGATFTDSVTAGTGSAQSFYAKDSGSTDYTKPNYSFVNEANTGMYHMQGNTLGFTVTGHPMWTLSYAPSINIEYAELRGNLLLTTGYELWIQSGKVGINNTSPTYDLDVTGTARITNLTDGTTTVSLTDVIEANHTHAQSDVTNLTTDLANKVDTTDARLSDARTPLTHTHPQSDITNLVTDLAGKASTNHSHDLDTLSDYTLDNNAGEGPVIRKGGGNGFFYTNVGYGTFAGNINIQDLNNVSVSSAATGDVLAFNGTGWANASPGVASDTTQAGGGTAVNNIVVISQAAYTALGTKDPNTIYFIT